MPENAFEARSVVKERLTVRAERSARTGKEPKKGAGDG